MPKNVNGMRFLQENLETNLESAIAGHQPLTRWLLGGFILLLCLGGSLVIGFLGAFFTLHILAQGLNESVGELVEPKSLIFLESLIAALVVITGMITAMIQRFAKSVLITLVLSAILVTASFLILNSQNRLPPEFLLTAISGSLASLLVSYLSFFVIRFADALVDIIFVRSLIIKGIAVITMIFPAMIGALVAQSTRQVDEGFSKILAALSTSQSTQVTTTAVSAGVVSSLALAWTAWQANRRRGVPWHHPDLLRSLALTVGSWGSTSFYNLDLSHVSFRNAQLANADLRARKLYRTCFQGASGLERANVDSRYLDLEHPPVQKLLTHATSDSCNYNQVNLQGAYLQNADLRRISLIDANLNGADLREADLRGAILARAQAIGADFTNANLTGICIKDWSVNDETYFSNVLCDYVYRELDEKGEPADRYPADRNFDPQEFESLYQELGNVAELIFKEGVNWRAFSFSMQKLEVDDEGLGLELKGFERRGDRWVVRVTHNQQVSKQEVEQRLTEMYEQMKGILATKEQQINQLLGIASDQAEALKEISQKPFGNSFFITGSTITNLTGSGNIEYTAAAQQVREIITYGSDRRQVAPIIKQFVQQLKQQDVATTGATQLELMQQLIVAEAEADPEFRAYLLQESQQILQAMAGTPLTQMIQNAITQITATIR